MRDKGYCMQVLNVQDLFMSTVVYTVECLFGAFQ